MECFLLRDQNSVYGPTPPSSAIWLIDVIFCSQYTDHFFHLCNHQCGVPVSKVCNIWVASCLTDVWKYRVNRFFLNCTYSLANTIQTKFFCKKLHCTYHKLSTTTVARQEHPDRLWVSPNILFSPYLGLSDTSMKATACACRQYSQCVGLCCYCPCSFMAWWFTQHRDTLICKKCFLL